MSDYTLKEYMAGEPLPAEEKPKSVTRVYYYGVYLSANNKPSYFVCKNEIKVCGDVISFKREEITGELAVVRAQKMLNDTEPDAYVREHTYVEASIGIGDIVIHADHEGQHTAIVLAAGKVNSSLLFITTNPLWHRRSRRLTIDELSLLGFSIKDKPSYFAPVTRSNQYIVPTGRVFPTYRVEQLKREFYGRK